MLRHPDEGRRQVGPVRGDLRAQRRRGAQARREDDRDLVPGVRSGVEGALRESRRRARRGVRVRGQALLRAGRRGDSRRQARTQGQPLRGPEGHVPRLVPHGSRAGQLRAAAGHAQGDSRCRVSWRWSTTAKRACAAARCSRSWARCRSLRFWAGTGFRRRSTSGADTVVALVPLLPGPAARLATSRTTSASRSTTCRESSPAPLGYDIPETTDYSMYMWGYFEKFIILLEPENMAKFMAASSRRCWTRCPRA